jgi:hypothetical protein
VPRQVYLSQETIWATDTALLSQLIRAKTQADIGAAGATRSADFGILYAGQMVSVLQTETLNLQDIPAPMQVARVRLANGAEVWILADLR